MNYKRILKDAIMSIQNDYANDNLIEMFWILIFIIGKKEIKFTKSERKKYCINLAPILPTILENSENISDTKLQIVVLSAIEFLEVDWLIDLEKTNAKNLSEKFYQSISTYLNSPQGGNDDKWIYRRLSEITPETNFKCNLGFMKKLNFDCLYSKRI